MNVSDHLGLVWFAISLPLLVVAFLGWFVTADKLEDVEAERDHADRQALRFAAELERRAGAVVDFPAHTTTTTPIYDGLALEALRAYLADDDVINGWLRGES